MSKKFKLIKSYVQNKKQTVFPSTNDKSSKKVSLASKIPKQIIIYSDKLTQKPSQQSRKLNRIQSQYIKSMNSQSLPKTPKISKVNSNKLIQQNYKETQSISKKYQKSYLNNHKNKSQCRQDHYCQKSNQNHKKIIVKNPFEQLNKKSAKLSNQSSKSLTKIQNQINKNGIFAPNNTKGKVYHKKPTNNLHINQKNQQKNNHNTKKLSKKQFEAIKLNSKLKSPSLKKIPSTCSVKKYYILNTKKIQKSKIKQTTNAKTFRYLHNPQQNISCMDRRNSYGNSYGDSYGNSNLNTMKIYNNSVQLNNTTNSSQRQRQILERVQRTLEYYKINLQDQKEKRKSLEIQNSILKEELMKVMKKNNNI